MCSDLCTVQGILKYLLLGNKVISYSANNVLDACSNQYLWDFCFSLLIPQLLVLCQTVRTPVMLGLDCILKSFFSFLCFFAKATDLWEDSSHHRSRDSKGRLGVPYSSRKKYYLWVETFTLLKHLQRARRSLLSLARGWQSQSIRKNWINYSKLKHSEPCPFAKYFFCKKCIFNKKWAFFICLFLENKH